MFVPFDLSIEIQKAIEATATAVPKEIKELIPLIHEEVDRVVQRGHIPKAITLNPEAYRSFLIALSAGFQVKTSGYVQASLMTSFGYVPVQIDPLQRSPICISV